MLELERVLELVPVPVLVQVLAQVQVQEPVPMSVLALARRRQRPRRARAEEAWATAAAQAGRDGALMGHTATAYGKACASGNRGPCPPTLARRAVADRQPCSGWGEWPRLVARGCG